MIPVIGTLNKVVKILHSDASPSQIAGGACFGMIMGLTPLYNVHNLLVLLLVLIIRVNPGSVVLSWGLFSLAAFVFDPLFHRAGMAILKHPALVPYWTELYNIPLMTWTNFNNSVVMGSLAVSLALFIPAFLSVALFVNAYRKGLKERMDKWKLVKVVKGSRLYQWYERVRDFTE